MEPNSDNPKEWAIRQLLTKLANGSQLTRTIPVRGPAFWDLDGVAIDRWLPGELHRRGAIRVTDATRLSLYTHTFELTDLGRELLASQSED